MRDVRNRWQARTAPSGRVSGSCWRCTAAAGYRPEFDSAVWEVAYDGTSWTVSAPSGGHDTRTVSGDDSALALFVTGRIPATPTLKVSSPQLAARLKTFFPGP